LIKQTVDKHTTIDTEDTELKCIRQPDGTLVTEKKKTTGHEDIVDKDLPDGDNQSAGSQEKILKHKVRKFRRKKLIIKPKLVLR
jgi:hypothetical protein